MRTKEKFYENLNNKHVSLEKRQERFEFKDVKTLDALLSEIKSFISRYKTRSDKSENLLIELEKRKEDTAGAYAVSEGAEKNVQEQIKSNQTQLADKKDTAERMLERFEKAKIKREDAEIKLQKSENELQQLDSEGLSLYRRFQSQLQTFISSANSMGLADKVSSLVSKYKSGAEKLGNLL